MADALTLILAIAGAFAFLSLTVGALELAFRAFLMAAGVNRDTEQ